MSKQTIGMLTNDSGKHESAQHGMIAFPKTVDIYPLIRYNIGE